MEANYVDGEPIGEADAAAGRAQLLNRAHEYLAVLAPSSP